MVRRETREVTLRLTKNDAFPSFPIVGQPPIDFVRKFEVEVKKERDGLSATFAENYDAVILSELVYDEELHALFEQILHARYDFPLPWWDEFSEESKDLVRKLLELSASRRLTAAQVRDGLPALCLAAAPRH